MKSHLIPMHVPRMGRIPLSMGMRQGKTTPKSIRIHNNKIIQMHKPLLRVSNVENIEFYENEIVAGTGYAHWESSPANLVVGNGVTIGEKGL